jgi:glycosyltransferase involved in cell wall biosynthesis
LYFPVEERLSAFTDVLFTVNEEDEALARRRMHAGKVVRLPGVGIDWSAFQRSVAAGVVTQLRLALGVAPDERLLLSVGELNPGKNHASVIRAMARLGAPGLHYVVCGVGPEAGRLSDLARGLGLSRQVHLVGFQGDVRPYLAAADAAVHVSRREGLGVFGLEALASGLPLIGSDVRGIRDYMDGGRSGYLVRDPLDVGDIARGISAVMATPGPGRSEIASHNRSLARGYDRAKVDEIMRREYALAIESARSG